MNRKREIIIFLIAALISAAALIIAFIPFGDGPRFIGTADYLRLFIKETLFTKSLIFSILLPLASAIATCAIITAVFAFVLRTRGSRRLYYLLLIALSSISTMMFFIACGGRGLLILVASSFFISTLAVFICWLFEPLTLKKRSYEHK